MVIWFSQPQPPPQLQDTDLGIMMDCESSSTRGYSSQGQFLRASRDQTMRGVFQENASRFTGMEIMTWDFVAVFCWEMNCSEVLS